MELYLTSRRSESYGLKTDHAEYVAVSKVKADEDDEENRPGSPPSIVYGSHREEHQFVLDFPSRDSHEEHEPVLLAREPLLFDNN